MRNSKNCVARDSCPNTMWKLSARPECDTDGHRFYVVGFRADMNAPDGAPSSVTLAGAAYLAHTAPDERYRELGLSADNNWCWRSTGAFCIRTCAANAEEEPDRHERFG